MQSPCHEQRAGTAPHSVRGGRGENLEPARVSGPQGARGGNRTRCQARRHHSRPGSRVLAPQVRLLDPPDPPDCVGESWVQEPLAWEQGASRIPSFRFPSLASVCSVCLFCSEGDFTLLSFGPRGTCILPLTPASQSAGGTPGDALGRRKMGSGHQISATESPGPPAIRVISGLATICSLWSFTCQGHSGAGKRGGAGGWSEVAEVRTCLRASAVTAPWSGQGHGVSGPMNGRGVQMAVNRLRPVLGCRSCVEPQSRSGTQLPRASAAARSGAERPRPPCSSCGPVWGSTSFFHWLTSTASLSSREAAGEK